MNRDLFVILCALLIVSFIAATLFLTIKERPIKQIVCAMVLCLCCTLCSCLILSTDIFPLSDVPDVKIRVSNGFCERSCSILMIDSKVYSFSTHGDTLLLHEVGMKDGEGNAGEVLDAIVENPE